ncbi:unnamed protein product [Brachionus calyciflorus]|uniref:Uncharacterized protein n=1 Tax=Brachionus calyciflorus TaxID=104777 RepID=A0A813RJP3_9BILA|nr:unnamed protein product [Brachionus calyciflorus]
MKSLIVFVLIGFACANAQTVDFLIDNVVLPAIDSITGNTQNFITSTLMNLVLGWLFNGKRDLNVQQVQQVILQVQSLFNQYKDKIDQLVSGFSSQIQNLFNIFTLAGPARSHVRVNYIKTIGEVEIKIKEESLALLNSLYQLFQQFFGQNFAVLLGSQSRKTFGSVTNVINSLTSAITQVLENYGEQLLQTAANISGLSAPLLTNLQQQLSGQASNLLQQIQQAINQLQN